MLPIFLTWPLIIVGAVLARYAWGFNLFGYWGWVLIAAIIVVFFIILQKFYVWKSSALIITDQRIVINQQHGFFSKTVTELLASDILEVSYSKKGISASMQNYGNIIIKTASDHDMVLENIANPDKTVEFINQMRRNMNNV